MTDEQFTELLTELRAIRAALEKKPAQAAQYPAKADDRDAPVPQPDELIDLPGAVEVPFGKNKGAKLDDLAENSLRWYAVGWVLREKNTGGFWPGDLEVRNAARQLWHAKHGSAKTATASQSRPAQPTATATTTEDGPPF